MILVSTHGQLEGKDFKGSTFSLQLVEIVLCCAGSHLNHQLTHYID